MSSSSYIKLQIGYIKWWSKHFRVSLENAAHDWVDKGMAEKFSMKYRSRVH